MLERDLNNDSNRTVLHINLVFPHCVHSVSFVFIHSEQLRSPVCGKFVINDKLMHCTA